MRYSLSSYLSFVFMTDVYYKFELVFVGMSGSFQLRKKMVNLVIRVVSFLAYVAFICKLPT